MRRSSFLWVLTLVGVLAFPAVARAGSVTVFESDLHYTAAPGEANNVEVTEKATRYVITEVDGLAITFSPEARCTALSASSVRCRKPADGTFNLFLGDGSDSAIVTKLITTAVLWGEDGNDILRGSNNPDQGDTLIGGPGADSLYGRDGCDHLDPGNGVNDRRDKVYGGAGGCDFILLSDHTDGVTVSLDNAANDGSPNERDNYRSDIEQIFGSAFDDLFLLNDGLAQLLFPDLGNDTCHLDMLDALNGDTCETLTVGP